MRSSEYIFLSCGCLGLLLAAPYTFYLVHSQGLSPWIELTLVISALILLLAVPLTVKVLTGREGLVFYRDVICIFTGVTLTLRLLHQPIFPYLDITVGGAGIFHACGRIGCLLAGCCYGRPCRLGVRYQHVHAEMGFPSQLVGVRLFPIQAIESLWILCLVAFTTLLVLQQAAAGFALATYVTGYALGRFFFEFERGDSDRPYFRGFSLAQWISLLLTLGVSIAVFTGVLPGSNSLLLAPPLLILTMLVVTIRRHFQRMRPFELLHPRHIHEVASILCRLSASLHQRPPLSNGSGVRPQIELATTSLGIHLSTDEILYGDRHVRLYCLSREGMPLSPSGAHRLARLISRLQHNSAAFELTSGSNGVVRVLFAT